MDKVKNKIKAIILYITNEVKIKDVLGSVFMGLATGGVLAGGSDIDLMFSMFVFAIGFILMNTDFKKEGNEDNKQG